MNPISSLRFVLALGAISGAVLGVSACGAPAEGQTEATSSELSTDSTLNGCPASAPQTGVSCATQGLQCTWGTDPRFGCRTESVCTTAGWQTTTPSCSQPPPSCPRTEPVPNTQQCSNASEGLTCMYGHQAFTCADYNGDLFVIKNGQPEKIWWSGGPQASTCPTSVPNLGSSCTVEGETCNYGGCFHDPANPTVHGAKVTCTNGRWQEGNLICIH